MGPRVPLAKFDQGSLLKKDLFVASTASVSFSKMDLWTIFWGEGNANVSLLRVSHSGVMENVNSEPLSILKQNLT